MESEILDKNQYITIRSFDDLKNVFLVGILGIPKNEETSNSAFRYCELSPKQFRTLCDLLSQIVQIQDDQRIYFPVGPKQESLARAVELLIGAEIVWFPGDNDVEIYVKVHADDSGIVVGIREIHSFINDIRVYAKYDLT